MNRLGSEDSWESYWEVDKTTFEQLNIDEMQFDFIRNYKWYFVLRQILWKYLEKEKNLYFAFIDLEKSFDQVSRDVLWWALKKLGVEEWLVKHLRVWKGG